MISSSYSALEFSLYYKQKIQKKKSIKLSKFKNIKLWIRASSGYTSNTNLVARVYYHSDTGWQLKWNSLRQATCPGDKIVQRVSGAFFIWKSEFLYYLYRFGSKLETPFLRSNIK